MAEENKDDIFSSYSPEELNDFFHYGELLGYFDNEDMEALKQRMNDMSWEARERELQEEEDEGTKRWLKKIVLSFFPFLL